MGEKVDSVVGEETQRDDLAHLAPVGTVGCEAEHGVVVGHVFEGNEVGAIGDGHVVDGVTFLGGFPVVDDKGTCGAEFDGEKGSVFVGHGAQNVMGWLRAT